MKPSSLKCPVALTSRIMGGKWKARIVWTLMRLGRQRFSDLRRAVPPISDRILSRELKELEGWGLIERTEFPVVPPKTEYSLTAFGKTLEPIMGAMASWGTQHRERFDE
ncbi:MAG: helix-turn-helix domain-containing protein [Polyangiaceae bacterium]